MLFYDKAISYTNFAPVTSEKACEKKECAT